MLEVCACVCVLSSFISCEMRLFIRKGGGGGERI